MANIVRRGRKMTAPTWRADTTPNDDIQQARKVFIHADIPMQGPTNDKWEPVHSAPCAIPPSIDTSSDTSEVKEKVYEPSSKSIVGRWVLLSSSHVSVHHRTIKRMQGSVAEDSVLGQKLRDAKHDVTSRLAHRADDAFHAALDTSVSKLAETLQTTAIALHKNGFSHANLNAGISISKVSLHVTASLKDILPGVPAEKLKEHELDKEQVKENMKKEKPGNEEKDKKKKTKHSKDE
ncbi:hypothetical protein PROFUN_00118 [Planoprotostelium fungivorum]|uniref:Uncharacterized protein n=1 Tax=Planoprotostelium fungivorum TaxID=1890364 RepID=A0A2P6P0P2_9EUKA|nr:hypothetical protein PROFUN_00118 [Planoprotostelium fungivorum]